MWDFSTEYAWGRRIMHKQFLMGKSEGKRQLGRPRSRLEENITMDLKEIGWGGLDWILLVYYRDKSRGFVNTVMNLRVP
jgi:hypothetical protein